MMDVLREKGEIHLLLHRFASKVNVTSGQIRFGQGCMSGLSFPKLPIVLCLLTLSGLTLGHGPTVIKVEGGADVVLPCSLSTKENIEFKFFDWRKVAQKDDGPKKVFMYDGGIHYNNGLDGQSEEFKGRVSHFPDELKHGDASIIIRNTKISDSGDYRCYFPRLQPPQTFPIKLVVGAGLKPSLTLQGLTIFSALLQCEVHGNPKPKVELQDSDGNNLDAKVTQVSEREGSFYITLQTKVTKTGTYRCVATQEEINHQIYAETSVHISGSSTGWIVGLVLLGLVSLLLLLVAAGVLAVLVYKRYLILNRNKVIRVKEGSDVTLPCSLWPKDIRSKLFFWLKLPQKTDGVQKVFLYDEGHLYSDERPEPKVITVREGSDVTLPCSLITKEDITSTQFIWKKVSQKTDDGQKVFLYDNGDLYSDERPVGEYFDEPVKDVL
ncbi:butyrophilin-like protein 1 [Perca fluviatilis]|uniref:butyrophilin-like protein 1 n=1 Tax=Perca fluviatilis TaxID=8168 RepID=UPI00196407F6|nr:butyrophilin-like protein 1 [Perca fluviatilis]